MRFLLRPGWLAFIAVVLGFVAVCYAVLAPWQFGREDQREAQQAQIDNARDVAPVPFADLVPGAAVSPDDEWRQVTMTGEYQPADEALVRLRVVDGRPAYEVMTPLRLTDGRTVAIDRGSITADQGQTVPAFAAAPEGTVTVTGRLRLDETDTSGRPTLDADGHRQIYAADSRAVAAAAGTDMIVGYAQLIDGQPGVLTALPVVPPVSGAPFTNFSYALQWVSFGAIALVALVLFIRLELLQRRGRRANTASLRDALSGRDGGGATHPASHTREP
ncbi:MAG: SURF1 family protein [Pseudonocardia sp.]|nr:SURF1 family protein [Pseudonocardia sp.]